MGVTEHLRGTFSFLTIIPVGGKSTLDAAARGTYMFPVVGAAIGIISGTSAYLLSLFTTPLLTAVLAVALIELLTGLHHFDALLDFGDGVMVKGDYRKKINAMHDSHTGAGGFWLGIMVIIAKIAVISQLHGMEILLGIFISEISAKFSMVASMFSGQAAYAESTTSGFCSSIKNSPHLFVISGATSVLLSLALSYTGAAMIASGIVVALLVNRFSRKQFGGITGDTVGSTDELAALFSLFILVVVL